MKKNFCVLLTASIDPKGCFFLERKNPKIREKDYIKSLKLWLEHTNFPIVFCENSNYDLSRIKKVCAKYPKRVEIIQYNGNTYPRELGKGYGEAEIIERAILESVYIKKATSIIKVTGRLYVENIHEILEICSSENLISSDKIQKNSRGEYITPSQIFIFQKKFFLTYFLKYKELINDIKKVSFEHILCKAILNAKRDNQKVENIISPIYKGYHATRNTLYKNNAKIFTEGVSIMTACMDREQNLEKSLMSWLDIPEVKQIIIVDWSSKKRVSEVLKHVRDKRIVHVQAQGEKYWSLTYAFNLAFQYVSFDKVLKLDADIILKNNFFDVHMLRKGVFFRGFFGNAREENEGYLNGVLYCYSKDLLKVGGYNEYLTGRYGRDDDELYTRFVKAGSAQLPINNDTVHHIPHSSILRTSNVVSKEPLKQQCFVNRIIEWDIPWSSKSKKQNFKTLSRNIGSSVVKRKKKIQLIKIYIYFYVLLYKYLKNFFDFEFYMFSNPDLKKNWRSLVRAYVHYLLFGKREGRVANIKKLFNKPFTGEFGFEIANVIPKIHYLYTIGFLDKTYGLTGTKPFYFFSKNHIEIDGKRSDSQEGLKMHTSWQKEKMWSPPNYKDFYKNDIFIYKKPICIIYNKYTTEWDGEPINVLTIETVKKIISLLKSKYQLIYIRPQGTSDERGYSQDRQEILQLNDYQIIKQEFPEVITFDTLIKTYPEMTFNELQMKVLANSNHFISVQGGGSRLCSFFGGINLIYHKEGKELKTGQYRDFYPKFSRARILICQDARDILDVIKNNF